MKAVFVAGSREISRLNPRIRERIDNILKRDLTVLVGDANGADKAVQEYLAKSHYPKVEVYCMEVCRNNIGNWHIRRHTAGPDSKHDRHYYGVKDLAMAKDAGCGFMLWDGRSKGTLTNIVNLLKLGKKTLLYLSPTKQFLTLGSLEDFRQALLASGVASPLEMSKSADAATSVSDNLPFTTLR